MTVSETLDLVLDQGWTTCVGVFVEAGDINLFFIYFFSISFTHSEQVTAFLNRFHLVPLHSSPTVSRVWLQGLGVLNAKHMDR